MKEMQTRRKPEMPVVEQITVEETAGALKRYFASHGNGDHEELCTGLMEITPRSQAALYQWITVLLQAWAAMPVKNDPSGPVVDASRKICELMGWTA